jgi:hypothetical protein
MVFEGKFKAPVFVAFLQRLLMKNKGEIVVGLKRGFKFHWDHHATLTQAACATSMIARG